MKKDNNYEVDKELKKQNRHVVGLNPSGFKYINYEDPYARNYPTKCPVCGKVAMIDKYGNGECKNCLWNLDRTCETNPDSVQYPNMLSLNKAKLLYKQGKPLKPSFEDFIQGLMMYARQE